MALYMLQACVMVGEKGSTPPYPLAFGTRIERPSQVAPVSDCDQMDLYRVRIGPGSASQMASSVSWHSKYSRALSCSTACNSSRKGGWPAWAAALIACSALLPIACT